MTDSVDDGTEGGYTAYSSEEFEEWFTNLPTDEQKAYMARITVLSGPVEYITTDAHMNSFLSEEYQKALIEKYGHTELHSTVEDDTDEGWDMADDAVRVKYIPAPEDDSGW